MKKTFIPQVATIIIVSILFLGACNQEQKSKKEKSPQDSVKTDVEQQLKEASVPMPGPVEVYQLLQSIGAEYQENSLNPTSNIDDYYTEKNKAVNLGVYAADLAYAVTYDHEEDISSYTEVVKKLVDDLEIDIADSLFSDQYFESVMKHKDTLFNEFTKVFSEMFSKLQKDNQSHLAGLMAAGAWVESLYLATNISKDTYDNYEIVNLIYQQKQSLNALLLFLQSYEDDQVINSIARALRKLKMQFDLGNENSLTPDQLESIKNMASAIRTSMVSS